MVLSCEFLLITFVWKESFSGDDLSDEVPIITAPFTTSEFDSAVFVNTDMPPSLRILAHLQGLKRITSSSKDDFLAT